MIMWSLREEVPNSSIALFKMDLFTVPAMPLLFLVLFIIHEAIEMV